MTTTENIITLIRENGINYWTVRTSESNSNTIIFKSDDKGVEANIERMRRVMDLYNGDYFVFLGKESEASQKGQFRYEFSNKKTNDTTPQPAQIQTPIINGISPDEVQKQIDLAVTKVKMEFREEDLKRRETELREERRAFQEEKEGVIGIAISKLGSVLPKIFPTIERKVAGAPNEAIPPTKQFEQIDENADFPNATDEEVESLTAKVSDLLNRWAEADPDCLVLLEKIVVLAESKDTKYTMAKSLI